MSGYAIFNIEIKKPEEYKEYVEKVKPLYQYQESHFLKSLPDLFINKIQ